MRCACWFSSVLWPHNGHTVQQAREITDAQLRGETKQACAQFNDLFRKLFDQGVHLLFLFGSLKLKLLQLLAQRPVLLRESAYLRCLGAVIREDIATHNRLQQHAINMTMVCTR